MKIYRWCRIDRQGCIHCGGKSFEQRPIIDNALALSWELTELQKKHFDQREGYICRSCRMSKRVRMLLWSLKKICPDLISLHILHINQINGLSQHLRASKSLVETTYQPKHPLGTKINGLSNQDMTHLTFEDGFFDLVVHSETLEHLHDYELGLREAMRVLKPGGFQIYTVPLLHERKTRRRIGINEAGKPVEILPPSFHGLNGEYPVVWEFGGDFIEQRKNWISQIHYDNFWRNKTIFSVVEKKKMK